MKESRTLAQAAMLGGCNVCGDESGFYENPLVYCDGQACSVAVHQACYGIVTVPSGPWYCRKCESTERSARVRCELCPNRDGALKRTESERWAHVVCALYIPEVRFGNVTTMEPILLDHIPSERFGKTCYICEEQGRGSRSTIGACMQCNKANCKQQFHVTCAQALGLLCEEAGNFLDNVKYCGYCQHHYSKLKKSSNVKTIPPYKPIPADGGSSDSSAEKDSEAPAKSSSGNSGMRRSSNAKKSSSSSSNSKNKLNPSPSAEVNGVLDEHSSTPKDSSSNSKFTTSNFVETIVTQSESVFGNENSSTTSASAGGSLGKSSSGKGSSQGRNSSSSKSNHTGKKRKTGARTPTVNENSNQSVSSEASGSVVVVAQSTIDGETQAKADHSSSNQQEASTTPVIMSLSHSQSTGVGMSSTTTSNSIVVSVPLTATAIPSTIQSAGVPTFHQQNAQFNASNDTKHSTTNNKFSGDDATTKRSRNQSTAAVSTGASGVVNPAQNSSAVTTSKRGSRNNRPSPSPPSSTGPAPPVSSIIQGPTQQQPALTLITTATAAAGSQSNSGSSAMGPVVKDSPPSSPGSESMGGSTGPGRKKRKNAGAASNTPNRSATNTPTNAILVNNNHTKDEKDMKLFQNGVSAPHMLGNQLNPSSTMAQKMSDTLSQEMEAHSIFTDSNNTNTNLIGPQLHNRVIASARSNLAPSHSSSFSNTFGMNSNTPFSLGFAPGAIPQTLEQLLERQWEQGSQFLMDQAQHFDIASLLSCLHQLKAENVTLEERVNCLVQRRDHLLAVNARLAIPLTTTTSNTHPVNNVHQTSTMTQQHADMQAAGAPRVSRESSSRMNNVYIPHSSSAGGHPPTLENGLSPNPSPPSANAMPQYQHRTSLIAPQPSPTIRHSPASSAYHQNQSSNIISPVNTSNPGVVRNSSVTPDPQRGGGMQR